MTLSFATWWAAAPDDDSNGGDASSGLPSQAPSRPAAVTPQTTWSTTAIADRALFAQVLAGDEEAMARLFLRFARQLERVALSVARTRDLARDAVQVVFSRLWERRTEIIVPDDVAAYLHRGVYHAAQNVMRTERREVARRVIGAARDPFVSQPSAPDRAVTDDELTQIVRTAITALPGRSGEIFRLMWTGDLTYAQISELTGISVKGVEKARARALVQLREALRGYWP